MSSNNSIAKNTLLLYFRMIIIMAVQLYTVRIVLATLGEVDYGLYNVVGGVVSMFVFFTATMTTASQRYFAFEIGKGDFEQLNKTFSLTLIIYCLMAGIVLVLAETIGIWFLNTKLVIPDNRIVAANWVFQFSILSFMFTMFQVPYDAIVIAREKMNVFAYVSILEVALKLGIVYLLGVLNYDKLIMYSILTFAVTVIITSIYKIYCLKNFKESHFSWFWDRKLFKEIVSYSGWNLFGATAGMMNNQGINIVLNMFFGPAVNAARGIAYQINAAISGFVQNFMTATRPQITKYYAQNETDKMLKLVFQSSKFSFFLLYIISLPIMMEMPFILKLWLKDVPDYTVLFARIIIITALVDSLSLSLMSGIQATGKVKKYQMVVGSLIILNVPISYLLFKFFNLPPETALLVVLFSSFLTIWFRLILLKEQITNLSFMSFFLQVIIPCTCIVITSLIPFLFFKGKVEYNIFTFFSIMTFETIFTLFLIFFIGINREEKQVLLDVIQKKILKR